MAALNSHQLKLQETIENSSKTTNPEQNATWFIHEITSSELDKDKLYSLWKEIRIIFQNPQGKFKTEQLLFDKSHPNIYISVNEVINSIENKLTPIEKEILFNYLLDVCIEDISFKYQEYTCTFIEEFEPNFDLKMRYKYEDDMKRIEDVYRRRDKNKMRGLLHGYMQEYRAYDYYDPLLDSFKLIMIQKNVIDLEIIQHNKTTDECVDSLFKLTRHNSIIRQPSSVGSQSRKKAVSFNYCEAEIIYEEQTTGKHPARSPPYHYEAMRSSHPSPHNKPTEVSKTSEKKLQKRNIKRVEASMKKKDDEKLNQRTCWYKDSCECTAF